MEAAAAGYQTRPTEAAKGEREMAEKLRTEPTQKKRRLSGQTNRLFPQTKLRGESNYITIT